MKMLYSLNIWILLMKDLFILPGLFCFQRRTNESNAYVYIYTTIIKQLGCKGHSYYNPSKLLHDC